MEQYVQNGEKLFRAMYRDTADKVQGLLDEIYPDMGRLTGTEHSAANSHCDIFY
jgi:hypothetical protein